MFTTGPGMIVAPSSMATGHVHPDRGRPVHRREVRLPGRIGARCPSDVLGRGAVPREVALSGNRQREEQTGRIATPTESRLPI